MLGEDRLDLRIGRDFAAPHGRDRLVDRAQLVGGRLVDAAFERMVDFKRDLGKLGLRRRRPAFRALQQVSQRLGHF